MVHGTYHRAWVKVLEIRSQRNEIPELQLRDRGESRGKPNVQNAGSHAGECGENENEKSDALPPND